MLYEFKARDGSTVHRHYAMRSAPPLGTVIRVGGKRYRRVLSAEGVPQPVANFEPYVNIAAPRNVPGLPCVQDGKDKGRVIIRNRTDEQNLAKATGMVWT